MENVNDYPDALDVLDVLPTIKPYYVPAGTEPRRGANRTGIRFRGLPYLDHNY